MSHYYMNWFKFPKVHCKNTDKINRDFFWNNNSGKDNVLTCRIHTLAWDKNL